jgi:hypothetical protein
MNVWEYIRLSDLPFPDLAPMFDGETDSTFLQYLEIARRELYARQQAAGQSAGYTDYFIALPAGVQTSAGKCHLLANNGAGDVLTVGGCEIKPDADGKKFTYLLPAAELYTLTGSDVGDNYLIDEVYFSTCVWLLCLIICRSGIISDRDLWEKRAGQIEATLSMLLSAPVTDSNGSQVSQGAFIRGR